MGTSEALCTFTTKVTPFQSPWKLSVAREGPQKWGTGDSGLELPLVIWEQGSGGEGRLWTGKSPYKVEVPSAPLGVLLGFRYKAHILTLVAVSSMGSLSPGLRAVTGTAL